MGERMTDSAAHAAFLSSFELELELALALLPLFPAYIKPFQQGCSPFRQKEICKTLLLSSFG
jgi:hypothetical protein